MRLDRAIYVGILSGIGLAIGWAATPSKGPLQKEPAKVGIIYVDARAKSTGDGTSWSKAFKDLSTALSKGKALEIWVAAGTYKPGNGSDSIGSTFNLDSGTTLYGGFLGGEKEKAQAQPSLNVTRLSGDIGKPGDNKDNANTVVLTTDANVIDGFHIKDGFSKNDFPAGVLGRGNVEISRCVFIDNHATKGPGALSLYGGYQSIHECIFTNNSGTTAGAIYTAKCSPLILNCIFHENTSATWAGGILLQALEVGRIVNSTFYGNSAPMGSAVAIVAGEAGIESKIEVGNCIFWKNQFRGKKGDRESEIIVEQINLNNSVELHVISSIVQGGTKPTSVGIRIMDTTRTHTQFKSVHDIDPKFIIEKPGMDLIGQDKRYFTLDDGLNVQFDSPAIGAGSSIYLTDIDILGNPRISGPKTDLGAYEQ
jgi:hypothetical protein